MNSENYPGIRSITLTDKEMVTSFFDQMGGETRAFFNRNDGNRKALMKCFETPNPNRRDFAAVEILADGTERMAGLVFLWDLNTRTPWLGIAVAEDWKGRHLGRRLMAYAEDYCIRHGKGGIFLTTHVANVRGQGLYTRSGYTHLGTAKDGELLFFHSFEDQPPQEDGTI